MRVLILQADQKMYETNRIMLRDVALQTPQDMSSVASTQLLALESGSRSGDETPRYVMSLN